MTACSRHVVVELGPELLLFCRRDRAVAMPTRVCSEFSTRVNKPENDDPSIVEPIAIASNRTAPTFLVRFASLRSPYSP